MFKKLSFALYLLSAILITLGLSISLQSLLAAWTAPAAVAPGGNVYPPINEGVADQTKFGGLGIGGNFAVSGNSSFTGNVGIGTTAPGALLDLGAGENGGYLQKFLLLKTGNARAGWGHGSYEDRLFFPSDGHMSFGTISISDATTWAEKVRIQNDGNVGIGTPTPSQKLDVSGSIAIAEGASIGPASFAHNPGHDNTVSFGQLGGSFGGIKVINYHDGSYNNQYLTFETHHGGVSAGERMRIDRDGNVGIGTTGPNKKLEIKGDHYTTQARLFSDHYSQGLDGVNTAVMSLWASEPGWTWSGVGIGNNINGSPYYGRVTNTRGGSWARFLDNAISLHTVNSLGADLGGMEISNGNVGIGTTEPGAKLDVAGNIRSSTFVTANGLGEAYAGGGGMNANYYHSNTNDSWFAYPGNNYNYIRGNTYIGNDTGIITTAGNVGIGTTDPTDGKLQVNGNISTGFGGIKWKVFSGTTAASASTSFLHGLSENNIISVTGILKTNDGRYVPPEYTNYAPWQYSLLVLGGRIYIQSVDTSMQGQPYKVIVYYQ